MKNKLRLFGKLNSDSLAIKYPLENSTVGKIACSSDSRVVMLFVTLVFKRSLFVPSLYPPTCFSSERSHTFGKSPFAFGPGRAVSLLGVTLFGRSLHCLVCQDVESLSCKTPSWQGLAPSFGFSHLSMFALLTLVGTSHTGNAECCFFNGLFFHYS